METSQIFTVIGALILILLLLLGAAWLIKRQNWLVKRNKQINMQIIGSQSLGARSSITAIQIEDTCLIVGITPQNISLLHSMPAATQANSDFAKELSNATAKN